MKINMLQNSADFRNLCIYKSFANLLPINEYKKPKSITSNHLSNKELTQIIKDLKEKDYYEFSAEVKERLLN